MEVPEAREHLDMVERILTEGAVPPTWPGFGRLLVAFGIAAAVLEAGVQLSVDRRGSALLFTGIGLLVLSYVYLVWTIVGGRRAAGRVSHSEHFMTRAMSAMWVGVFVASFAQPQLFSGWSASAIWNLGGAIQMLIVGFLGDRRAVVAGVLLLASIIGANLAGSPGYVLAAGFLAGYLIPGISYIARPRTVETRG